MKALLDPIWSWPVTLLVAAGALVLSVWLYQARIAHLGQAHRRWLLALRLASWAVLALSTFRPALEFTHADPNSAYLAVVTDFSRSMTVSDGPGGISRHQWMRKVLADAQPHLEALSREVQVRHFEFAEELAAVEAPRAEATGGQTAMGQALDQLGRQQGANRLLAALLLSDGAQRAMPPADTDPKAAAMRLADQQVRVDTVCFGASGFSESVVDLIAEDLEVSPTVFVKNTVVASARVRALGAEGKEVAVRLLVEDPSGRKPGQPPTMKLAAPPVRLRPSRAQELMPIELSYVAEEPGEFRLTLEVMPLEGEAVTTNNQVSTYISVLKGGVSVAYFDREHRPEQRLLRRVDESPDIRLDFKPIRLAPHGPAVALDPSWFAPGKYDVYIIGSVPARVFGAAHLAQLSKLVESGAGLLMTGGTLSFGPGGYASSPLADLLPVEMLRTEAQHGDNVDPSLHYTQPLQMLPTQRGLSHFVMRLDAPEKNLELWRGLPPLNGANRFVGLKPAAMVLADSSEQAPLLIAQEVGRGRAMAFAADSTYLWYHAGRAETHQRFWQQTILWLAHKDVEGDKSVWVKLDGRRFRPGQPVGMSMGARDPEKGPIADAQFDVEILGPGNTRHKLTPERQGSETLARFLETQKPGEYRVQVMATKDGAHVGMGADARFLIYEQDLELYNPASDPALMEEIARITGGVAVAPEELAAHVKRMASQPLNVEVTRVRRVNIWDNAYLLLLFALLMTLEWILRKKRGLV
jgi:hypothetical protein